MSNASALKTNTSTSNTNTSNTNTSNTNTSNTSTSNTSTSNTNTLDASDTTKSPSISNDLYSGVATLGKIRAIIFAIIFGLLSIGLLIGGIMTLVKSKNYKPQPNDTNSRESLTKQGWIMIGASMFIAVIISISLYITFKYKAVAAIGGAAGVFDLFLRR